VKLGFVEKFAKGFRERISRKKTFTTS